jgi:proteasome lid subunit RPN8/RPN11
MEKTFESTLRLSRFRAASVARPVVRVLPKNLVGARLEIPVAIFNETLAELQERSSGARESAAVWSGEVTENRTMVQRVDFHHGLGDDRATALSLELSEAAKFRLYRTLGGLQLKLAALIHTHPEDWVDLSEVDRTNQISSCVGFWSLVVPNYGRPPWETEKMGIHLQTEKGWYRLDRQEVHSMVHVVE